MITPLLLLVAGAIMALLAVVAGAFGAHGLAGRISPERLDTFEIAVRYQMYHALGLMLLALALDRWPPAAFGYAGAVHIAGVVIFSGTLYALALGAPRWLGAVTPIGGLLLIAGWAIAAWSALRTV
jgi:uncharacterized membrane protein YgdD (TMEM256/DUF423 family)